MYDVYCCCVWFVGRFGLLRKRATEPPSERQHSSERATARARQPSPYISQLYSAGLRCLRHSALAPRQVQTEAVPETGVLLYAPHPNPQRKSGPSHDENRGRNSPERHVHDASQFQVTCLRHTIQRQQRHSLCIMSRCSPRWENRHVVYPLETNHVDLCI